MWTSVDCCLHLPGVQWSPVCVGHPLTAYWRSLLAAGWCNASPDGHIWFRCDSGLGSASGNTNFPLWVVHHGGSSSCARCLCKRSRLLTFRSRSVCAPVTPTLLTVGARSPVACECSDMPARSISFVVSMCLSICRRTVSSVVGGAAIARPELPKPQWELCPCAASELCAASEPKVSTRSSVVAYGPNVSTRLSVVALVESWECLPSPPSSNG